MEQSLDGTNAGVPYEVELWDRVITNIKERKERIKNGQINSIPWPYPRFAQKVIGFEKAKIYQVTAGPKVAKSKFSNFTFLYNTYNYLVDQNLPLNFKVKYFCLEESKETLIAQFMAFALFTKSQGKLVVNVPTLLSTEEELSQDILDELENHKDYIQGFLKRVEYIEDVRHPFGIYNNLMQYALANGKQLKKTVEWSDKPIDDVYIPNDPDEIVLAVVDHVSLLKDKEAITELMKFSVTVRNKYKHSILIIQQQALDQTSRDGMKFNNGEPTISGLGDNKLTSRDVDITFALYSPFQHKIETCEGYDTKFYKDNIRILSVLQSRHGGAGVKVALYFHGGVNFFSELPKPDTIEEQKRKKIVTQIRNNEEKLKNSNAP